MDSECGTPWCDQRLGDGSGAHPSAVQFDGAPGKWPKVCDRCHRMQVAAPDEVRRLVTLYRMDPDGFAAGRTTAGIIMRAARAAGVEVRG